jgi:hypothetical protein
MLHELGLFAPAGTGDLDLPPGLHPERLSQQFAFRRLDIGEDQPGDRLVVIELAQEGGHDVRILVALVDPREIGPIAPVLACPEEEDLDAGLAALGMQGEDIRLFQSLGIDLLFLGDGGERADPVTQARGPLELHVVGGLLHLLGHAGDHRPALAAQEVLRLLDQLAVVLQAYEAGAGRSAALNLVQHAGPRAGLVDAVRARAQQEGLLQGVQRAIDRPGAGERSEIVALDRMCAAVLAKLGRLVIAANDDLGETLVVAQQDVEAWL